MKHTHKTQTGEVVNMPKAKYEIYKGAISGFNFRLKGRNGKLICFGSGYSKKQQCQENIKAVKNSKNVEVVDLTKEQ